jgi:hypothetical protein
MRQIQLNQIQKNQPPQKLQKKLKRNKAYRCLSIKIMYAYFQLFNFLKLVGYFLNLGKNPPTTWNLF